jgi:fumarate reductase (CoM/CoB) subunit A
MKKVAVVGAGLAGMIAAITACREGAEVLLVDRGSIGLGSNSAMANGVFTGPGSSYGEMEYVADTIKIGRGLNRKTMVEAVAREARRGIELLRSTGLDITETTATYSVKSPDANIIPGVTLVRKVAETARALSALDVVTGFCVTEIVKVQGAVRGIRGFDRAGKETMIPADAVVLATGGAGAIYLRNDNQKTIMGQGYRLAAEAGLDLWDMEFVQYYPLVFADPHLPSVIVYPPYDAAVELINSAGEDLMAKYNLGNINEASLKKRDEFSATLFGELRSGPVFMDFRKVPSARWREHPLSLIAGLRFDFSTSPVAVSPGAHFFMGGVRTDEYGRTELPGLFACGEVVAGLHGANRRGGNALMECLVFGAIAGRNAATEVLGSETHPVAPPEPQPAPTGASADRGELRDLRQEIRRIAWSSAGVVRTEGNMKEGLAQIDVLRQRLRSIQPETPDDRRLKLDLASAAFTVRAVLTAGLGRKESRGSFLRSDFPDEDNAHWKKNSCLKYDSENDTFTLSFGSIG